MKTASPSGTKDLIISQSPHGAAQNNKAMDFAHLKWYAKADNVKVNKIFKIANTGADRAQYPWKQSYFHLIGERGNWYDEVVHGLPTKAVGGVYKKGELVANTTYHHFHEATVYKVWERSLDFMDRTVNLHWLKIGQKHPVWTSWSTYKDLQLPDNLPIISSEMVNLQQKLKCKVTATIKLNVRQQPNTTAPVVGQVDPNTVFETQQVASGSNVEGVTTWYKYGAGWISGKYVQEIVQAGGDTSQLEKQLADEKAKNKTLTDQKVALENTNKTLTETNQKYKPGYDAAKLIQTVK